MPWSDWRTWGGFWTSRSHEPPEFCYRPPGGPKCETCRKNVVGRIAISSLDIARWEDTHAPVGPFEEGRDPIPSLDSVTTEFCDRRRWPVGN